MFGKVYGHFFLEQYLGITNDETSDTATLSVLIETSESWKEFISYARPKYKNVQLFTMFEPSVIKKTVNPEQLVFLYNGTNDIRKNVSTLTRIFARVSEGTKHLLIVKTNNDTGLTKSKNIRIITERISNEKLTSLFNLCDYCITCTRGEGVSLLHLEGAYFGKPTISHDKGVFRDVKEFIKIPMISIPSKETQIDLSQVPLFLHKVFYGSWWEIDESEMINTLKRLMSVQN